MKEYEVHFTTTLPIQVEAESESEAEDKAYQLLLEAQPDLEDCGFEIKVCSLED